MKNEAYFELEQKMQSNIRQLFRDDHNKEVADQKDPAEARSERLRVKVHIFKDQRLQNLVHDDEIGSGSYGRVYKVHREQHNSEETKSYALKYFNVNC